MRWTRTVAGTIDIDPRTAKSCGPDAPTLVSSRRSYLPATVARKPGHRGERAISRKTIAQGVPGETGVPVVTMLVCFFYFAREAAGALGTRHSLRPPIFEGGSFINPGAARRGNAGARFL